MTFKEIESILDVELDAACHHVSKVVSDQEMILWDFEQSADVAGFVTVESNEDEPGTPPTLTIAVVIDSADGLSRDELIDILELNAFLYDATLIAEDYQSETMICIQWKTALDAFVPGSFNERVTHLLNQYDRFGEEEQ